MVPSCSPPQAAELVADHIDTYNSQLTEVRDHLEALLKVCVCKEHAHMCMCVLVFVCVYVCMCVCVCVACTVVQGVWSRTHCKLSRDCSTEAVEFHAPLPLEFK